MKLFTDAQCCKWEQQEYKKRKKKNVVGGDGIASDCGLEHRGFGVRVPVEARFFSP
jgi:hypothetical protein